MTIMIVKNIQKHTARIRMTAIITVPTLIIVETIKKNLGLKTKTTTKIE